MDKKMAILIIAVFCLLCVGSYLIYEPGKDVSYHEMNLTNSCSAMVPLTDKISNYTDNLDIHYYCDYEYDLNITSFNNGSPITASQGLLRFENIKEETLGSEVRTSDNLTYYTNNGLGTYTACVDDERSNNHILISSKDLTILKRVYSSLEARVVVTDDQLQDLYSANSSPNESRYY